ncbi:MAG: MerR family transcriptional regulator [Chitinispirillaceae bacterium]|nr:MerR family transcriptional regulator [Chitinispirillaceae bacterium]
MLKIGDFSKLGRVTVKTLRYWDEIGLLRPDFVSPENGYRYYSIAKLALVHEILSLKELGLFLEDIEQVLKGGLANEEWISLLRSRRNTLTDDLHLCETRIQKIDRMIETAEKESNMPTVEIRELPEVIVASYRTTIPDYNALFKVVPPLGDIMRKQGAECRIPEYCFNIYHDGEYREKDIDVEICEAVNEARIDGEGIIYKKVAAVPTAAVIMHRGGYDSLRKSYSAILSWVEENDFEIIDNPRESYIDGIWNRENPDDWRTEIQIPVSKVT